MANKKVRRKEYKRKDSVCLLHSIKKVETEISVLSARINKEEIEETEKEKVEMRVCLLMNQTLPGLAGCLEAVRNKNRPV